MTLPEETPRDRFDILIVRLDSMTVSSIAGYDLLLEPFGQRPGAADTLRSVSANLGKDFSAIMHPSGELRRGDAVQMTPELSELQDRLPAPVRVMGARTPGTGYTALQLQRKADCQCVDCGSPNLETEARCLPCASKYNLTTAAAKRKARGKDQFSPV